MLGIKSRMTCMFVKIRLFKMLTRRVLTRGCEIWKLSLSQKREDLLKTFERNILRGIFVKARGNRMWIIKYNEEI